jgi:hypothetical protein
MNKVILFLKSRTFLTVVAMVAFNLLQAYRPLIPVTYQAIVDVLMTALTGYYKTNPSQDYVNQSSTPSAQESAPQVSAATSGQAPQV